MMSGRHIYNQIFDPNAQDALGRIGRMIEAGSTVLELGPATGYFTRYLSEILKCTVDCIEWSEEMAQCAAPYCREMWVADLDQINLYSRFKEGTYDYIIAADVLEHLRDPWRVVEMCRPLLRTGGKLLLSIPNIGHAALVGDLLKGNFEYRDEGLLDRTHLRFFTRKSVLYMLRSSGFRVDSFDANIVMPEYTEYKYHLEFLPIILRQQLLSHADALTYQFIVSATVGKMTEEQWETLSLPNVSSKPSFQVALFWTSSNGSFTEERSKSIWAPIGIERQLLRFELPDHIDIQRLRLDPSDRPGFFHLFSIHLKGRNLLNGIEENYWSLNNIDEIMQNVQLDNIHFCQEPLGAVFVATTGDPKLFLDLPIHLSSVKQISWTLEVDMDWPMSADFLIADISFAAENKRLEESLHQQGQKAAELEFSIHVERQKLEAISKKVNQLEQELEVRQRRLTEEEKTVKELTATLENKLSELDSKTRENVELHLKVLDLDKQLADSLNRKGRYLRKIFRKGKALFLEINNLYSKIVLYFSKLRKGVEVTPTGSFKGNLELPLTLAVLENGLLKIHGWLFAEDLSTLVLRVILDGKSSIQLRHGIQRDDVLRAFPHFPQAKYSGFEGTVPIDLAGQGGVNLGIEAELKDGRRRLAFTRSVKITKLEEQQPKFFHSKYVYLIKFILMLLWKTVQFNARGHWPKSFSEVRLRVRVLKNRYRFMQLKEFRIKHAWEFQTPYERWLVHNAMTPTLFNYLKEKSQRLLGIGPKISIIVPVFNTPLEFLMDMVQSVKNQIYPNWELCLADDCSTQIQVKNYLSKLVQEDSRIKVIFRQTNGHISEATNSALELSTGDYVAFLDHDDELSADAILHVAEQIYRFPDVDWIYTDEDKIDSKGRRYDPQFKGEWSPEMALTHNYTHHLTVIRRSILQKVGGLRKGFEGAQDLDLFLRVSEQTTPDRIRHVPYVCYHWRAHDKSTASNGRQKKYIFEHAKQAINEALDRRGLKAKTFLPSFAEKHDLCLYQLHWDAHLIAESPVTIIIPTKDRIDLLKPCIDSLERTVDPKSVNILIIDDRTKDIETLNYLEKLHTQCSIDVKVIRPKRGDGTFNFARLINEAVEYVQTSSVLILNNDIEAMEPGWLEDMVGWLTIPGVEAVGARLLFSDQTVQHAGITIGPYYGLADHFFIGQHRDQLGYLFLAQIVRNVSALTGACLLTRVETYKRLGGMDEQMFPVAYNDVDFCLRLWKSGGRAVYTPHATLVHRTGASRGQQYDSTEHLNFIKRYPNYVDPFVNRTLDRNSTEMALNPTYVGHVYPIEKIKMLLLTHNLNFEGAPIVAFELAKYLTEKEGFSVVTLSPLDGPLRKKYEEAGLPLKIIKESIATGESVTKMRMKLKDLGQELAVENFDLIGCNTLNTFWGIELAKLFNKPSIWYVHESTNIEEHFLYLPDPVIELVKSSFTQACRVVIAADATAQMYHHLDKEDRIRIVPGGLPLDRIAEYCEKNTKEKIREKYCLPKNRKIITLIGTTCERKGQHVFIDAADHLIRDFAYSKEELLFVLVGGREGEYLDNLRRQIKLAGEEFFKIYMETPEVYDFYALSDIFVCASSVESFPMVVLLAMAFRLPLISTNVYGIPEIISSEMEGLLVPPGQPKVMAEQIHRILSDLTLANRLASHAWCTVQRKFDNTKLLSMQADLCREAIISYKGNSQ
ncbi:MAG: glycosyltransferase [Nitrospirae bacterium]|nr:glycosyltransferase [Candidatus Manganitrophaceae bacterium]